MRNYIIEATCSVCGSHISITVDYVDWLNWKSGMLIQHAFPCLDKAEREMLISRICGNCFDFIFTGGEE